MDGPPGERGRVGFARLMLATLPFVAVGVGVGWLVARAAGSVELAGAAGGLAMAVVYFAVASLLGWHRP